MAADSYNVLRHRIVLRQAIAKPANQGVERLICHANRLLTSPGSADQLLAGDDTVLVFVQQLQHMELHCRERGIDLFAVDPDRAGADVQFETARTYHGLSEGHGRV
jgi:predicted nicotinamide N-methyase